MVSAVVKVHKQRQFQLANIPVIMCSYSLLLLLGFISVFALIKAKECTETCPGKTVLYDDLRCVPKFNSPNDCCAKEYDCSHIYNRPAGTCHLQGKFYKPDEPIDKSIGLERCDEAACGCEAGGVFQCVVPSDSCAEFWVPDYVKPGCYLKHELKRCCNVGQKCPPFDGIAQCDVNGVIYKEGQQFEHPTKECTKCICDNNFNDKIEGPFCRQRNCTTELLYSKEIEEYCAPYYRDFKYCCPNPWICPSESGTYLPASKPAAYPKLKCRFGEKLMGIGEKYEVPDRFRGKTSCECIVPPYLTCTVVH